MSMPIVTLSNGVRVGNFSSPHPFVFVDGTTLPACTPERCKRMSLSIEEAELPGIKGTTDVVLVINIPGQVQDAIDEANARDDVDIVLIPFMVMDAMKEYNVRIGKCRVIRVADRVTKAIHIDRFCV